MSTVVSEAAAVFKEIYQTFFLRDILGKFVPGLIIALSISLLLIYSTNIFGLNPGNLNIVTLFETKFRRYIDASSLRHISWILLIGISYTIGFCNQILSELMGLSAAYPYARWGFFFRRKYNRTAHAKFSARLALFKIETKDKPSVADQRERQVIIKELSGNMIIPFFIIALIVCRYNYFLCLIFIILSILLLITHKKLTERQYMFEMDTLKKISENSNGEKTFDLEAITCVKMKEKGQKGVT